MVKKLDGIKEAISQNSTPVKISGLTATPLGSRNSTLERGRGDGDYLAEDASTDGSEGEYRTRRISAELSSYRGSTTNLEEPLPDNLYPLSESPLESTDLVITSCSQCHNCSALVYDEEIMLNWFADDSNLNTVCPSCNRPTVPLLTITMLGEQSFSVPYLNPLVLRKELENILQREGDLTLSDEKFVENHPIVYWNLVWMFERINVQSHLPGLCMKNKNKVQVQEGVVENEGVVDGNVTRSIVEDGADPLSNATNGKYLFLPGN